MDKYHKFIFWRFIYVVFRIRRVLSLKRKPLNHEVVKLSRNWFSCWQTFPKSQTLEKLRSINIFSNDLSETDIVKLSPLVNILLQPLCEKYIHVSYKAIRNLRMLLKKAVLKGMKRYDANKMCLLPSPSH